MFVQWTPNEYILPPRHGVNCASLQRQWTNNRYNKISQNRFDDDLLCLYFWHLFFICLLIGIHLCECSLNSTVLPKFMQIAMWRYAKSRVRRATLYMWLFADAVINPFVCNDHTTPHAFQGSPTERYTSIHIYLYPIYYMWSHMYYICFMMRNVYGLSKRPWNSLYDFGCIGACSGFTVIANDIIV